VKRQKEKQYESAREYRLNSQIRNGSSLRSGSEIRRLPFHCCALTLNPFNNPVCSPNGIIYELTAILPHLLKYKSDPSTGEPMSSRDLVHLQMQKDESGNWTCPVLNKQFTDYSKIAAVRFASVDGIGGEANVYSYEAVEELNLKAKNYEDLISAKRFDRKKDLIILQDPKDDEFQKLRDINNFVHIKNMRAKCLSLNDDANNASVSRNVNMSLTGSRIMDKIKNKRDLEDAKNVVIKRKKSKQENSMASIEDVTGVRMTTGKCSGSATSSIMEISYENNARQATSEELLDAQLIAMKKRKKKGYVRIHTNLGNLDVELHCDIAPRTTMNFLGLAEEGYYDDCVFHRSVKNFMIQGGKPPARKGEERSFWTKPFKDEFDDRLKHSERGLLSMANAGPGTNKSQFFITYKSCVHLDRKHSVFGRLISGFDVLDAIEAIPTNAADKPKKKIVIHTIDVVADAVKEAQEEERVRIENNRVQNQKARNRKKKSSLGKVIQTTTNTPLQVKNVETETLENVGRYLPKNVALYKIMDEDNLRENKIKEVTKKQIKKKPCLGAVWQTAATAFWRF